MARSVFRFLSRQPDTVELAGERHLLRLPRFQDYRQWYALRSQSRRFLEPWEPTWQSDDLTEGAFRARVLRNEQEFSSGRPSPSSSSRARRRRCSAASQSAISGAEQRNAA